MSRRPPGTQHLAVYLICFSCRCLPEDMRVDYFFEWIGELSVFLTDPEIRPQARRNLRALLFAADNMRGVLRMTGIRSFLKRRRKLSPSGRLVMVPMVVALLASGATVIAQLCTSQWKYPTIIIGVYAVLRVGRWRIRRRRRRPKEATP